MLPGFGSLEASTYVPSFSRKAAKMADKWVELMQGQDTFTIDVPAWTARATLWWVLLAPHSAFGIDLSSVDALGEAAFDYQFNALDDMSGELTKVFNNLFAKTRLNPGNWEIFVSQMVALMPDNLVRFWNENVPDKKRAFLIRSREASERVARQLVEEKSAALLAENGGHDIMSLLGQRDRGREGQLVPNEMLASFRRSSLPGTRRPANTISWILLELCRNTDVQTRLRDEIRTVRRQRDEPELTAATFDDMPYMTAIVKEILRFHPAIYNMHKEATRDDIVPLSHPVVGTDGKPIHEIPVQKGQKIILSTAAYNRDTNVFGADAHSFNPDRWLKEGYVTKQSLGVFANLLTFGGGNRACLGWRFAVLELSAFLVELVDKFEFSIDPKLKIQRGAVGFMIPLVEGEIEKGSQLPLQVRLAPSTD
ncbi:cytochrome P450 [Schizophyllum amplum]|uniref:Cytochrome P450 n=1 Tax=Schizophyllum amplum TaxID=97359 RepID=A0A550BX98_9AGAR|nr:cytochrome P450 [Auriculariopsis ampla]